MEVQKALNEKIGQAKQQMLAATTEMRSKLEVQEQQNEALQTMVMDAMSANMENVSGFANQSSVTMDAMREMFEQHRTSQVEKREREREREIEEKTLSPS